jgi:hypothetical protein
VRAFVRRLAAARIGRTYNQYAESAACRDRLGAYLERCQERQLTGAGPAEATATIVRRTLDELGVADDVLLWNVVPTHPGTVRTNRRPTTAEIRGGMPFLVELLIGRVPIAVGRVAQAVLGGEYVRHPSHGGAVEFRAGLLLSIRR